MSDSKRDPADETPETTAALYTALQQVTIHSQENKSFTLYNFLLFNSFLLVAWATLFAQESRLSDAAAATIMCIVGVVASLAWEPLGRDYADASDGFRKKLVEAEAFLPKRWPRPSAAREAQIKYKPWSSWLPFSGTQLRSGDLLVWTPRLLLFVYLVLVVLTWVKLLEARTTGT